MGPCAQNSTYKLNDLPLYKMTLFGPNMSSMSTNTDEFDRANLSAQKVLEDFWMSLEDIGRGFPYSQQP